MNRARLAAIFLLLAVASAGADEKRRTHALLVGCTDYPNLEKHLWLWGSVNDVELMRGVLVSRL
ncbi:MAG: hypothetical protein ACYS99_21385, partial [Planctomycetota bacterium]